MFCPNCRKELSEDAKFCGGCGTRIAPAAMPAMSVTPVTPAPSAPPVAPVPPEASAAPVMHAKPAPRAAEAPGEKTSVMDKLKGLVKGVPSKVWLIGGIALAALVVLIVAICFLSGGSSELNYALYLKDSQLYYRDFSRKAPYQIPDDLLDDAENAALRSYASDISYSIHLTDDGKTMFFLDKLGSSTGTLYYRSLTNFGKEAEKIASGVSRYTVSENGKLVTYLKNGTLYQYNMKDETKLAKDVYSFRVSSDGKIIYYRNNDDVWYVMKNGESEKIGSGIEIIHTSEDWGTVYYTTDGKLYRKEIGKDKEKLASDVYRVHSISDDWIYYSKCEEVPLSDFFVEDTGEYEGLMEMLAEEVGEFYELYYFDGKKETKLSESCGDIETYSYDNGVLLTFVQQDPDTVDTMTLTELVEYYYTTDHYYVVDAATELVSQQLEETGILYLVSKAETSELTLESVEDITLSADGKTMFALCEVEEDEGVLYQITLSGGKVKSVAEYDSDVSASRGCYYAGEDHFVYFKELEEGVGDLYVNGAYVDSDVYAKNSVRSTSDGKSLVYYADYDAENSQGTLRSWDGKTVVDICDDACYFKITDDGVLVGYDYHSSDNTATLASWNGKDLTDISEDVYNYGLTGDGDVLICTDYSSKNSSYTLSVWNGKKLTDISDDVYKYTTLPNGDVLYLYDYSTTRYEGELYLWNGSKSELLDEEVVALVTLPGTTYHYFD